MVEESKTRTENKEQPSGVVGGEASYKVSGSIPDGPAIRNTHTFREQSFLSYVIVMNGKKPSATDCAYLAGLIDADGTICMLGFQPKIEIASTDKKLIDWISSVFGGLLPTPALTGETRKSGKLLYRVIYSSLDSCVEILRFVLPYLKLKQPQAKLLTLYCLAHVRGFKGRTIWETEIRDELRRLNKGNSPSGTYLKLLKMAKKANIPFPKNANTRC